MKKQEQYGQFFSIAAISLALLDNGKAGAPAGFSELPGTLEVSGISAEVVSTTGGFNAYPVFARAGQRSGEAKLTLNECPAWLERIALGGTLVNTAAADGSVSPAYDATSTAVANINTVKLGNSSAEGLKLVGASIVADNAYAGRYWVSVDSSGNTFTVTAHTEKGRFEFAGLTENQLRAAVGSGGDLGYQLGDTGVHISVSQTGGAYNAGDLAYFDILPKHSGIATVAGVAQPEHQEYALTAWSVARRSPQDNLTEIVLPRVMIHGYTDKAEFNVAPNGVEFSLQMLAPEDGGAVFTKKHLAIPR